MRRSWIYKILTLTPAIFATVIIANGQDRRDSTIVLSEVVVVDSTALRNSEGPVLISTISGERIGYRIGESIAELLHAESFLFVQRIGSTGLASASARGAGAQHTQILLDGMALADPQTGQLDLTSVPSIFVQSVSIHHGGSGVVAGRSALGGIVNLRAVQAPMKPLFRVSGGLGAYGRRQLSALISRPFRTIRSLIAIDIARIDGQFPFENPTSLTHEKVRREGADRNAQNLYARLDGESQLGTWHVATWMGRGDRGVPGPVNAEPITARQQDRFIRFWASGRFGIPDGLLDLGVSYTASKLDYAHPGSKMPSRSRTQTIEFQTTGRYVVSKLWWLEAYASVGQDRTRLAGGRTQQKLRTRITAERTTQRSTIRPGLGVESTWVNGNDAIGVLPSLSVRRRLFSKKAIFFRSSIARVLRTPTFNELYWVPGGNPELRAEKGWSVDAGLSFQFTRRLVSIEAQATAFRSSLKHKIVWHPALSGPSIQTWRPGNIGRVVSRGIEGSLSARIKSMTGASIVGRLIYAYSRVEDRSAKESRTYSRQLRYVPEHVLKSVISVSSSSFGLDVLLTMIGPRYITSDETQSVSAYQELSVRLRVDRHTSHGKIRVQLALENATDGQFDSIRFYPMPPRHVRLYLSYELGYNH